MRLKKEIIERILGIEGDTPLTPIEMTRNLKVTFFPAGNASNLVRQFSHNLRDSLSELDINIIPFEEAQTALPFVKKIKWMLRIILINLKIILNNFGYPVQDEYIKNLDFPFAVKLGRKIRKGVAIIATGVGETGDLPIDYTTSFKKNPVITILDKPRKIDEDSTYVGHMETALNLFAWHVTNLVVTVDIKKWTIYSFNGGHPTYPIGKNFRFNILNHLIPKIAAAVRPPMLSEFVVRKGIFDVNDNFYRPYIDDLVQGGALLAKTGLYPPRKLMSSLKFRNNFYRWVGGLHLDKRSGMSFGFVARQLPVELSTLFKIGNAKRDYREGELRQGKIFRKQGRLCIYLEILGEKFSLDVPDVWILTSRSGTDKSSINKERDIIKMGLVNGEMIIETPVGVDIKGDYKPSFDTRVILSHAVGNAIFGSIISHFKPSWGFPKKLKNQGMALAHWHGYIRSELIPNGWTMYGENNPSVSCSSPQSALYAFLGKEKAVMDCLISDREYKGDIHIEPHHGVNFTYESLQKLANFLLSNPSITQLG